MDLTPALEWRPPEHWLRLTVVESHAGGEPFRVVIDGLPSIPGDTVLERRHFAEEHLDGLRTALMWEPRGHADMYGGWIGAPVESDSDLSVLFLHNDGFSTMCGHGIIALTKVVLDTGVLQIESDETTIRIDTPAGQVTAMARMKDGRVTTVRFRNVPSFALEPRSSVDVAGIGEVTYDIGFGGAFYAYVEADSVGVDLADPSGLVEKGRIIKQAISRARRIEHDQPDLGFLYGVIFTGKPTNPANHSRNVCVFADGEVDRSPTGTGVSGRLAILHSRGEIEVGRRITIESIVGSEFTGQIVDTTTAGEYEAVIPEISGSAHIVGRSELWIDPDDPLNPGFLIR
jgi:proline racemase